MYLLGKKIRPKHVEPPCPMKDVPHRLGEDRLAVLVKALRDSTITDREKGELFFGHLRMALFIAGQYASKAPSKAADLASEASQALLLGIRDAATKLQDDRITYYLTGKIHGHLSRWLNQDRLLPIAVSTFHFGENRANTCLICNHPPEHSNHSQDHEFQPLGQPITPPKLVSFDAFGQGTVNMPTATSVKEYENTIPKRKVIRQKSHLKVGVRVRQINELIEESIKTEDERKVIELRRQYYTDVEIAAQMGVTPVTVGRIRARVAQRYEQLEAAEQDS